jgi:voltage-dependent potassium channel beta subunit
MEYRKLGKSGLRLSVFSFGSWVTFGSEVNVDSATQMMSMAYEHGINFFDNAEVYAHGESERIMGQALKKTGWGRDTFCVSSKVFWGGEKPTQSGLSRKHIFDACHAAMKRLQVEYLDLYFCHRPDVDTPVEETVRAMNDLITQGKILYWGTSEWSAQQLTQAFAVARENHLIGPTMEQPEYNLFHRQKVEAEFVPLYRDYGLGTTIWSPLASGLLTGKYNQGVPKDSRLSMPGYEWLRQKYESPEGRIRVAKVVKLTEVARELGVSVAQMSLAWCARNPDVSTVILGASRASQLEENLKALAALPKLTPEVMAKIENIVQNKPEQPEDLK